MDKYQIDSHKLMFHVERVNHWLQGDNICPIYMEISPVGNCNHRCTFCGVDFMGYQNRKLETATLKTRLTELGQFGLKSVMYAGEGEPLLHRDIVEIAQHTAQAGIDVAFTTNAVRLTEAVAHSLLPHTRWIKVSINAGQADTYAAIHRAKARDFQVVINNCKRAVQIRHALGATCTLGMQLVLLPENRAEAVMLAEIARDIGMDYLVIKAYSQHTQGLQTAYEDLEYTDNQAFAETLAAYTTDTFEVIVRTTSMQAWNDKTRTYEQCMSLPFWSYIDAGGNVWGCSVYLDDEKFHYGNIAESSFKAIWEGEKRQQSLQYVAQELDLDHCRVNCRMHQVNEYLWALSHRPAHVNFI